MEYCDGHQISQPLVNKIIADDSVREVAFLWVQHNGKSLPLLWADCICGEIQYGRQVND